MRGKSLRIWLVSAITLVLASVSIVLAGPMEATLNDGLKPEAWFCFSEAFKLVKNTITVDGEAVVFTASSAYSGGSNLEYIFNNASANGFHNQLLHLKFKYSGVLSGDANFISFVFRCGMSKFFWSLKCYGFCLKSNQIEIGKFGVPGTGNLGTNGDGPYIVPTKVFSEPDKVYDIKIGAIDEEKGVRLTLIVDGQKIADYLDDGKFSPLVMDPGKFVISPIFDGKLILMKV